MLGEMLDSLYAKSSLSGFNAGLGLGKNAEVKLAFHLCDDRNMAVEKEISSVEDGESLTPDALPLSAFHTPTLVHRHPSSKAVGSLLRKLGSDCCSGLQ